MKKSNCYLKNFDFLGLNKNSGSGKVGVPREGIVSLSLEVIKSLA
jgi:hypothetical protein